MSNISLRPYQQKLIDDVRDQFCHGFKRVVAVAPCGAGKTITTGWMIREALKRGKRSVFFVHRHELIEQTSIAFSSLDIPHGIIAAGIPMQPNLPVQIASVQTLARRLKSVPPPDFLICDECHHILANTYKKIIDAYPNAFLLGVTATPLRMGGVTLRDSFDSMVVSLSVNQLIELGNLTAFRYFAPKSDLKLDDLNSVHGDFDNRELELRMDKSSITGDIVAYYRLHADGKKAICYCVNVNHSMHVAEAFNAAGIPAAHCDGETPAKLRAFIVNEFRKGKLRVLCNANLFGEGFDVPDCQAVILARPTKSLTLYIQQAMRPLRPDPDDPNKIAVIIDHAQNCIRHGLPNAIHHWSLNPFNKRKIPCPACGKKVSPVHFKDLDEAQQKLIRALWRQNDDRRADLTAVNGRFCPRCCHEFEAKAGDSAPPPEPERREGSLNELIVNFEDTQTTQAHVVHKPTSIEDFLILADKKGYKKGWAAFQALQAATSYEQVRHIADVCGYKKGWAFYQWQERTDELAQLTAI